MRRSPAWTSGLSLPELEQLSLGHFVFIHSAKTTQKCTSKCVCRYEIILHIGMNIENSFGRDFNIIKASRFILSLEQQVCPRENVLRVMDL